jgi:hypothetical protein
MTDQQIKEKAAEWLKESTAIGADYWSFVQGAKWMRDEMDHLSDARNMIRPNKYGVPKMENPPSPPMKKPKQ